MTPRIEFAETNVNQVADVFSYLLRRRLGPTVMANVVLRNAQETSKNVCHSHDFCDANQIMSEAFWTVLRRSPDTADEDHDVPLWNAAWEKAIAARFVMSVGNGTGLVRNSQERARRATPFKLPPSERQHCPGCTCFIEAPQGVRDWL